MVAEHSAPIKGKVVEILGYYEPTASDKKFVFDKEKVATYLKNGAKASNTVAKILNKNGFDLPVYIGPERKPKKVVEEKKPEVPKPEEGAAAPAEAASEEVAPETEAEPAVTAAEEAVAEPVDEPKAEESPAAEPAAEEAKPEETAADEENPQE